MKGQEFDVCDLPFDGYYAPQVDRKRGHFGCPFRHQHVRPGYVPFGPHGFGNQHHHGHHHHGNHHDHHKRGPEDGHRRHGCGRWGPPKDGNGPSEHHFHGPPGFRPGHDGRPQDFYGHGPNSQNFGAHPWWFGRRGPSESAEHQRGPWGGPHQRQP